MITEKDIRWGKYGGYEGPFYGGRIKFVAPFNMDFLDKALSVLTATEGGAYDAINMYDRCILSVGLIQWCEVAPQCSVSKMLGRCAEIDAFMMETLIKKFPVPVSFKKNAKGDWRFFLASGKEVDTPDLQRQLFFGDAKIGKEGTWGPEGSPQRIYAKKVAAWFANVWEVPLFRTVQAEFTKVRVDKFAMKESLEILFKDKAPAANESWSGALRAAYLSFAGNNPTIANKAIQKAAAHPDWASADMPDKFRIALQTLTFSPGIKIYPERYDKIAPVLTKLFGVQIPKTHKELRAWADAPPEEFAIELSDEEKDTVSKTNSLWDDVKAGLCSTSLGDTLLVKLCSE